MCNVKGQNGLKSQVYPHPSST